MRIGRATQPEGQTLWGETNRLALSEKHADSAERLAGPNVALRSPWRANAVRANLRNGYRARAWIPINQSPQSCARALFSKDLIATPTVEKALTVGDDLLETMGMRMSKSAVSRLMSEINELAPMPSNRGRIGVTQALKQFLTEARLLVPVLCASQWISAGTPLYSSRYRQRISTGRVLCWRNPVIALLRTKAIGCSAKFNPIG